MLVLGSGGRGESLLAPDQDNAIVHEGSEADDPWFKEVAERIADLLDAAGIPYCMGKVMASNAIWRRSLTGWEEEVLRWLRHRFNSCASPSLRASRLPQHTSTPISHKKT